MPHYEYQIRDLARAKKSVAHDRLEKVYVACTNGYECQGGKCLAGLGVSLMTHLQNTLPDRNMITCWG